MRQNQDWSARLFSIRHQVTGGALALLAALLAVALVFTLGLRGLLEHARWQARANEVGARLHALDQKLSREIALELRAEAAAGGQAFRGQIGMLNGVADDLARLHDLLGDDAAQTARVRQMQEVVDYWRGRDGQGGLRVRARLSADEAAASLDQMQALAADLARAQAQQVAERSRAAERLSQKTLLEAALIALLAAALALAFSRRLAHRLVDPLQQMMLAAERLTLGHAAPHVLDTQRDETGQLARAFNKMAAHVSEREAATLARNKELDDLHYFNSMLQTSNSEEEIHRALLQKVRALDLSQAVILDRDADENSLTVVASLHPLSERDLGESHAVSTALADDPDLLIAASTPLCRVVRAGKEVVVPDIADDLMCSDCRFGQQRGSAFCVPVTAGGHTIGALHLSSSQTDYWTGERQRLVKAFVDQAAPAINNLRLMEKMRSRALVDEQTQVYNRRFLDGYLRKQVAAAERLGQPLGVMMLDIDHFKRFNDQYGHEAGDFVLRQFAKAISGALREGELVARYGGEEFTVVTHGTAREAMTLAERLRRAVSELSFAQFTKTGEDVRITMSVGIAEFPTSGQTPEEVLKAADLALYRAKSAGRNCVKMATRTLLAVRAGARR
jgi:diguanylate cyclase (GGDEF)-like protein